MKTAASKGQQGTVVMFNLKLNFPDMSVRTFQVPSHYKLREIAQYLVKEKLEFGDLCDGNEFVFLNLTQDDMQLIDQECTPQQIQDSLGGRANFLFRRMFFLRDAKRFNPSVQMIPFDQFMLGQIQNDFIDGRIIYPVKNTILLTTYLVADRHGAYNPEKHKNLMQLIPDCLPGWTLDIQDWPKRTTGLDIISYFPEMEAMTKQNYEEYFCEQVVKQWADFSKMYNAEDVPVKARAKFMEFAVSPEFELYSQIQVFRTRYSGRQDELAGDLYFGIGPMGIHFFDKEGLFTKYGYHYHTITNMQISGRKLTVVTDEGMEHIFESKDVAQIQWLIGKYNQILMQIGEAERERLEQ